MILSLLTNSYCFFCGAFIQINIIPFSVQILHMDPNVGGYLFGCSAIGTGLGALLASKMKQDLKILVPFVLLGSASSFLFHLFPFPYWINAIWLLLLGVSAGVCIVPTQAFLVSKSEPEDRARNFGTANFLSFVFCLLAAVYLYVLNEVIEFNAAQNFSVLGVTNFIVAALLYWKTKNGKNGSAASNNR